MQRDRSQPAGKKWLALLVVVLALIWVAVWKRDRIREWWSAETPADPSAAIRPPVETIDPETTEPDPATQRWEATTGAPAVWSAFGPAPPGADPESGSAAGPDMLDCAALDADWGRTCRALAGSPRADGDVCEQMDEALAAVLRNPPSVAGELRDHARMLSNVTHLFRTLGRERLTALRSVLQESPEDVEAAVAVVSRRAVFLGRCAPELRIPEDAAYRYAVFLFGSLGGQAYLRRRTPRIEALASFYALVTLDESDRTGNNPEGIDLRPEISRTRQLLLGQSFLFENEYLNRLDRMQARWENRAR